MGRKDRRSRGRSGGSDDDLSLSGILDRFTSIDEKVDDLTGEVKELAETNRAIAEVLSGMGGSEVSLPSSNDLPLVADAVIQPALADGVTEPNDYDGNTETVDLEIPRDGYISQVYLSFPAGANQSIGVGLVGRDQESLIPYGPAGVNYVALDDKTVEFSLDYDVDDDESVTFRFINQRVAQSQGDVDDLTAYASGIVVVTEEV